MQSMLRFQLLRLGVFRGNVRFDFFSISVVVGQSQALIVSPDNAADSDCCSGHARAIAADVIRMHNQ